MTGENSESRRDFAFPAGLLLNALAGQLASMPPGIPHGEQPGLDLLLCEVFTRFAGRQAGQSQSEWHQVQEFAVTPLLFRGVCHVRHS